MEQFELWQEEERTPRRSCAWDSPVAVAVLQNEQERAEGLLDYSEMCHAHAKQITDVGGSLLFPCRIFASTNSQIKLK
jgi:hypothetical protein